MFEFNNTVSEEALPITTFPSTVKSLLILVVPVAAPISIVVAAPAKLTVVAVVLTRLKVVVDDVKSCPSICKSPFNVVSPVTVKFSSILTRPVPDACSCRSVLLSVVVITVSEILILLVCI